MFLYNLKTKNSNVIHINRIPDTDKFNVSMLSPEGVFIQTIGTTTESKLIAAGYVTRRTIKEVVQKSRRNEQEYGFHYLAECDRQEKLEAKRKKLTVYKKVKVEKFYDNLDEGQLESLREMLEGEIGGRY